jgi:hypothetical protein
MISLYNALRAGGLFDDKKPYFDNTRPTKITAEVGTTAQLSCKVFNLYNHTVRRPSKKNKTEPQSPVL